MAVSEIYDFLKSRVDLFKDFPQARLEELVQGSRVVSFEPNEAIVEFGEEGRFLGVLLEGEAEVSITDDGGQIHRLAVLKSGDLFGEMSLMTGDKSMADVIGVSLCKALLIPQNLFSSLLMAHPPAIRTLSKILSERSRDTTVLETQSSLSAAATKRSQDPYGFKLKTDQPMKILVVNCGSSSLKYNLYDTADEGKNARGLIENIGTATTRHGFRSAKGATSTPLPKGTHREAFLAMVDALRSDPNILASADEVTAVGHRVVHGGDRFNEATLVTEEVAKAIEGLSSLAPLHNPVNLLGIKEAQKLFTRAYQIAVFDTAFHHTLPPYAYLYGLPYKLYEENKIRRYGFHGTSHAYVSLKAAEFLKRPFNELEIVSCHLGNGASVCAIDHGRSVDTSMGFTPAEGLIMGTRCGNLDPAVLVHLMRTQGMTADQLDKLIQKESGLLGLSGVSNDMREIEQAADAGNHRALLAYKSFAYQIRKYIGAYVAAMGGLDVVVFTGGIGQNSAGVRSLACQGLGYMGISLDEAKNRQARGLNDISDLTADPATAPVRVLVVPTDEERMIARETVRTLDRIHIAEIIAGQKGAPIPIEVSAHHVHLSQQHIEMLFGAGHQLTAASDLSQPGQYACKETVNLIGPKGTVEKVRVLGPARKETQVEISMTEQFKLGIHPPIRDSGDLKDTPGVTLQGTSGNAVLERGVICAHRHIHMSPEEALRYGLRDRYMVRVRVEGDRELVFGDVLVRVHPNFRLAMHLDTDEANAAHIATGTKGFIDGIQSRA